MTSQHEDLLHYLLGHCLLKATVNGAQGVNITYFFLSSASIAVVSAPALVIVTIPLASMSSSL